MQSQTLTPAMLQECFLQHSSMYLFLCVLSCTLHGLNGVSKAMIAE